MNATTWRSTACRIVLLCGVVIAGLPALALAEVHEVLSVSHRKYESMFFDPHFLRIEPGDTVVFAVTDADHQPRSVFVPSGARHWQAEMGKSIKVRLEREGLYVFDCAFHNVMGMAGIIVVGRPLNLEKARRFFAKYKDETFAMNQNRLDAVWRALRVQ